MFKIATEGVKNLADAYKSYQEAKRLDKRFTEAHIPEKTMKAIVARTNRKHIRRAIKEEPALEKLDDARKSQLIALLNALVMEENNSLPAPIRFARHKAKSVILRIRGQKPPT
ncbi:MAG TPA: hypothetical protein VF544_18675 [Pyrinomonadaceae bacterium]|jgi:hypothetical protein